MHENENLCICAATQEVGMNSPMETLNAIRNVAGNRQTTGIDDATIARFVELDPSLAAAIQDAGRVHADLMTEFAELLQGDEADATAALQSDFINFYPASLDFEAKLFTPLSEAWIKMLSIMTCTIETR